MKPFIAVFFTALSLTIHAQTPPATDRTAELEKRNQELEQRLKNLQTNSVGSLVGKWMMSNGDQIEFTKAGMFTITIDPLRENAPKVHVVTGPYVVTPELKLKLITNNRLLLETEFSVTGDRLTLKGPKGDVNDHIRLDHLGIAKVTLQELRMLDSAIDQWAIEKNKQAGARPTNEEVRKYLRKGSRLYNALGDPTGPKDVAGNPFAPFVVDTNPKVNPTTFKLVSDVAPKAFWETFAD